MSTRERIYTLIVLVSALATTPVPTFAAEAKTFAQVVSGDGGIVYFFDTYVIPLLYALMFLFFVFGIFRYFYTGGEENREKGRVFVLWSLIGMVAVFSVWGVVNLLLSTLAL